MLSCKPELTILEACHRLALSEGQKENENEKRGGNGENDGRRVIYYEGHR